MTKTGRVKKLNKLNRDRSSRSIPMMPRNTLSPKVIRWRWPPSWPRGPAGISVRPGTARQLLRPFHWNDAFGEHLAINAVTSDAIDSASQQPEFKVCAVTLTKVALPADTSTPAADTAEMPAAAGAEEKWSPEMLTLLAESLGVTSVTAPQPDDAERIYLAGLVAGLQANPTGVPTIPRTRRCPGDPQLGRRIVVGMFAQSHRRYRRPARRVVGDRAVDSG